MDAGPVPLAPGSATWNFSLGYFMVSSGFPQRFPLFNLSVNGIATWAFVCFPTFVSVQLGDSSVGGHATTSLVRERIFLDEATYDARFCGFRKTLSSCHLRSGHLRLRECPICISVHFSTELFKFSYRYMGALCKIWNRIGGLFYL